MFAPNTIDGLFYAKPNLPYSFINIENIERQIGSNLNISCVRGELSKVCA